MGIIGFKSTTNPDSFGEHFMVWRCEDKSPSKVYYLKMRMLTFLIHDSNGGRRFFMLRDVLPLGGRDEGLYEGCRD